MADIVRHRHPRELVRRLGWPFGSLFRDVWEDLSDESGLMPTFLRDRFVPSLDVREDENQLLRTAELPGVTKDDIDISVRDGVLTLRGAKRQEEETKEGNCYRAERVYGAFERSIRLPEYVDEQKVAATYKDGILTLTLPKKAEVKPRAIEIKDG